MLSLLIVSENQETLEKYVLNFSKEREVNPFDITTITPEGSMGIEEVRNLQKSLFLAPIRGGFKVVILKHMHLATAEAQNALLKILEEPPINTQIILTAKDINSFLPTVLSRCKVILLDKKETTEIDTKEAIAQYEALFALSPSDKLSTAQTLSESKEKAASWIKSMIISFEFVISHKPENQKEYASFLTKLIETNRILQSTNVNIRFIMEHFLLNL